MLLKKVNNLDDCEKIKKIFHEIFPEEPKYDCIDFINSVTGNHNYNRLEYYTVVREKMLDKDIMGFCGIYSENNEDAWIGWYGIRPKFRRRGYGIECLHILSALIKSYGYKYIRLYTDKVLNNNAYNLYLKDGFIEDSKCDYNFVTMIKSINNDKIPKYKYWKEIPLGFESEPPHHFN